MTLDDWMKFKDKSREKEGVLAPGAEGWKQVIETVKSDKDRMTLELIRDSYPQGEAVSSGLDGMILITEDKVERINAELKIAGVPYHIVDIARPKNSEWRWARLGLKQTET